MIIGIDLGTTNSAAAIFRNGDIELIPNRYGDYLTPSVVYLDGQQQLVVGKHAKARLKTEPGSVAAVFKRAMGSDATFTLAGKKYSAVELSALVLRVIKDDAEQHLKAAITEAVISVPAYFNDHQRKATKLAAEMAGLTVNRLINEPTAAAMAYGLHNKDEESNFMVLDLGGGTFDVSIMEYFDGVLEVHASAGDNFLGGEDFLDAFVGAYLRQFELTVGELSADDLRNVYQNLQSALHKLSVSNSVVIPPMLDKADREIEITRDDFNHAVMPLLERMRQPMERAIRDADLTLDELDQVILVGGATRMPCVHALVAQIFRKMPTRHLDPDLVVAMGTAIQAGLVAKDEALDDVVLTDVCPYTLGVAIRNHSAFANRQGDSFSPIIERNCVVPVSKSSDYSTTVDDQELLDLRIFQGESRLVKNNVYLGGLEVRVPKNKAGHEQVEVRFSYDMNGILEVDVTVVSTGEKTNTLIDNSGKELSPAEIKSSREKLAALKIHPRDDELNVHLLHRAERLYEIMLGELRESLRQAIAQFEQILSQQNPDVILSAREGFSRYLDDLEQQARV